LVLRGPVFTGAAEAGFFPGMIFYLTLWFPAAYRGRVIGYFMAAIPLSTVIGAPISSALLGLDGVLGMHGWQWLFILEAAPALLLSVVALFYLTDKPADAGWLRDDERSWLVDRLAAEERQRVAARHYAVLQALLNPRVLALSLVYFGAVAATGSFTNGLLVLVGVAILALAIVLLLRHDTALERVPKLDRSRAQ
jgi:LPXTG-motif cell wall-anchored protein